MQHIYYDPSNDYVGHDKNGNWYAIVDGKEYGYWHSKAMAIAGMKVEQERAEKRRVKHAEEAQ